MSDGWIKLHRSLLSWEWYDDANTMRLFIHCLLMANHSDKEYHGTKIEKGSFLTGRKKLSKELRLSEQTIRTSLNRLKSTNEITIKSTSKGTVITINNYKKYQQINQQSNQQVTNNQPASNQQVTTNKKEKNDKNEKNIKDSGEKRKRFVPPTREDVIVYRSEKGLDNLDVDKFIDYYTSNGWMIGKNHMKDWKSCARNWNRNEDKYQRQGITAKGTQRFNNFDGRQYSGADMNEFERMLLAKKN